MRMWTITKMMNKMTIIYNLMICKIPKEKVTWLGKYSLVIKLGNQLRRKIPKLKVFRNKN